MAYKIGNKLAFHATKPETPSNERIVQQRKDFLDFVQQYVVLEDGKVVRINETQIEDELGLDNGQLQLMYKECEKAINETSLYPSGVILAMLFGMWAMETKWEHIEDKPVVVE